MKIKELFETSKKETDDVIGYKLVQTAVEAIKRDCQYFLTESKGLPMMRGQSFGSGPVKTFQQRSVRADRVPRSSGHDPFFQWSFDACIQKLFNFPKIRSSAMFVTGAESMARYYGSLHYIFPIGKFDFIWSPKVNDSYEDINFDSVYAKDSGLSRSEITTWQSDELYPLASKLIKSGNYDINALKDSESDIIRSIPKYLLDTYKSDYKYQDNDLFAALKSKNEILVPAPCEYYSVSDRYLTQALGLTPADPAEEIYAAFIDVIRQ